jgi:DNA-binding transcriptional MocR family regulator
MLLDQNEPLLIESPAYSGSLAFLRPLRCRFIGILTAWCLITKEIDVDDQGLVPEHLEQIMSTWKDQATRPKVLYTVPIGSNPSGCSTSPERKQRIYEISRKYDILILEDDPYYYLQVSFNIN